MARVSPTLELEHEAHDHGFQYVIGLDEVGRGAVAGPVAVGAAILALPVSEFPEGLRDSKQLTALARNRMLTAFPAWLTASQVGFSSAVEVDRLGISAAQSLAAFRALSELFDLGFCVPEHTGIMIDGHYNWLNQGATAELVSQYRILYRPKLDRDSAVVAAASVIAKVARDELMANLAIDYPKYGWHSNVGYGSVAHRTAVSAFGTTPEHRQSWVTNWLA